MQKIGRRTFLAGNSQSGMNSGIEVSDFASLLQNLTEERLTDSSLQRFYSTTVGRQGQSRAFALTPAQELGQLQLLTQAQFKPLTPFVNGERLARSKTCSTCT